MLFRSNLKQRYTNLLAQKGPIRCYSFVLSKGLVFFFFNLDMLIILLESITESVGECVLLQADGMPTLEHHLIY